MTMGTYTALTCLWGPPFPVILVPCRMCIYIPPSFAYISSTLTCSCPPSLPFPSLPFLLYFCFLASLRHLPLLHQLVSSILCSPPPSTLFVIPIPLSPSVTTPVLLSCLPTFPTGCRSRSIEENPLLWPHDHFIPCPSIPCMRARQTSLYAH